MIEFYLNEWSLSDAVPIATTPSSQIYKVRFQNETAVLKVFTPEGLKHELCGIEYLRRLDGHGAVKILKCDAAAYLMEHIDGCYLKDFVVAESDDEATLVLCEILTKIHSSRADIPAGTKSMRENFRSLFESAAADPLNADAAKVATKLLERA